MKILILTPLFQPEPNLLKGLAFATELQRRGHEIDVLTGFPNYPTGKLYSGYRQRMVQKETIDGVRVTRIPSFLSHDRSGLRRFFSYSSFALVASFWGIFLVKRPALVFVYQGPASLVLPALVMRLIWRTPYILDIQDIWPESVQSSGMMNSRLLIRMLHAWCDLTYKYAARILVLSPGYKKRIIERKVKEKKIVVVYNWSENYFIGKTEVALDIDRKFDPKKFNIVYAGNIGTVQALGSIITTASLIKTEMPDVVFHFIGDGVEREALMERVCRAGLSNVSFHLREPNERIKHFLAKADALLVHLKDEELSRIGIPQKVQAYLSSGRPILMAIKGDAADLVREAKAGIFCEPEDPESISEGVKVLVRLSPEERRRMGENGRLFFSQKLAFAVGIEKIVEIISSVN